MRPLMLDDLLNEVTVTRILANQGARDKKARKRAKKLARRAADPERQQLIKSKTYLRDRVKQGEYDPEKYDAIDQSTARSRQSVRDSIQSIKKSKATIASMRNPSSGSSDTK